MSQNFKIDQSGLSKEILYMLNKRIEIKINPVFNKSAVSTLLWVVRACAENSPINYNDVLSMRWYLCCCHVDRHHIARICTLN